MIVLVAALAVSAGAVLGATFRAMYLHDHGRHRPHAVRGHHTAVRPPAAIARRWS